MFDSETEASIISAAEAAGLDRAALLAVIEVESGGSVFALINGRREPLIRFEGHYFDRRLNGLKREQARIAALSSPTAGAIANPRSQVARWKMLARASAIDRRAAYESVSWGLGQVMGAHWKWLGYPSVEALVSECRSDAMGQVRVMLRFIEKSGLDVALRNRDWKAFARGYNGPAYAANAYDAKMATAYRRHAKRLAASPISKPITPPTPDSPPLSRVPTASARPPLLRWLLDRFRARAIADRGRSV